MIGAVARFVYMVNNGQILALVMDLYSKNPLSSEGYGLAFYGACASGGTAIIGAIFLAIARCSAGSGDDQDVRQIQLVNVTHA